MFRFRSKPAQKYSIKKNILLVILLIMAPLMIFLTYTKNKSENRYEDTLLSNAQQSTQINSASVNKTSVESKTVCIDPGHGGDDIGASYKDISESEINLTVALDLKRILVEKGFNVIMTRDDDTYVQKRDRAYFCNEHSADIMVAIHHNAYEGDNEADYSTALYYKDADTDLATAVLNSISKNLNIKNQGISKFDDSQLWIAKMPAILTESFFITSDYEYKLLKNSDYSRLLDEANAIASGIDNYFNNNNEDNSSSISADSLVINRVD